MRKSLSYVIGITAIMLIYPAEMKALRAVQSDLVSVRAGFPYHYTIYVLGFRSFPIRGTSFLTRFGVEYYMFGNGKFCHGRGDAKYTMNAAMFCGLSFLLFPSTISEVGTKTPFYSYLFLNGTTLFAKSNKLVDEVYTWGGGDARFWRAGIGLSFRSIVDLEIGYSRIIVNDHLGLDSQGNFVEYVPDIRSYKPNASVKVNLGSAIVDWIAPGLLD